MAFKIIPAKKVKVCDYCEAVEGDVKSGDGGAPMGRGHMTLDVVAVKRLACNHDICSNCYWYPGDMNHCPVCGPNRPGAVGNKK